MTKRKKKEPFWIGAPTATPDPIVTNKEEIKLDDNESFIHVTCPEGTTVEDLTRLGKVVRECTGKKILCTVDGVKIKVVRSRNVRVEFTNSKIDVPDFFNKLKEAFDDENVENLLIRVDGTVITKGV